MTAPRLQQYFAFLDARGMKLTRERRRAAAAIFATLGPFAPEVIDEVVAELKREHVSRATVFRTLGQLEEAGLVRLN